MGAEDEVVAAVVAVVVEEISRDCSMLDIRLR